MTKRLVAVRLFDPKATGDAPASGVVECRPTLRRHIEGGDPDDFIVLPAKFTSRLGAALDYIDANEDEQTAEATDGVAWFWIDVTDEGDYADLWAWTFTERTSGGMTRTIQIPTGSGTYEYGDADDLDPDDFSPATPLTPGWTAGLAAEAAARANADTALDGRLDAIEVDYAAYINLARSPDLIIAGAVTRDGDGAATSAAVTWPDGTPGTYTADTLSVAFPGAVDGYHITYGSPVTKTFTQPTITRDGTSGAATDVPAIVVS